MKMLISVDGKVGNEEDGVFGKDVSRVFEDSTFRASSAFDQIVPSHVSTFPHHYSTTKTSNSSITHFI